MSAAKKLAATVTLRDGNGTFHTFGPDSDVPGWARKAISNPKAWEGGVADSDDEDETVDYASLTPAKLKAEIKARNKDRDDDAKLPEQGSKEELVAILENDDAASE